MLFKHSLIAIVSILVLAGVGVILFVTIFNGNLYYAPTVKLTNGGAVRGIVQQVDNGKIYLYQGIRFGRANRFEKPQLAEPWDGVYDATYPRDSCPQLGLEIDYKGYLSHTYSEDCLLLNVWRPIEQKANRTVMFYVYGGGYKTGSIFKESHDGRYIAYRGDVIMVTVNYRLGAFGFMYGGDDDAPANLGLYDQILGLKWVQENIAKFGGDPNSVTLFGNSAGSTAVGSLVLSPLTKGLFQRAIIQSGVPLQSPQKSTQLDKTQALASELDCANSQMSEIVKCIKGKSVEQILNATRDLDNPFGSVYGDELMPVRPIEALTSGKYNADIDLLYGVVKDEGTGFAISIYPELNDDSIVLTVDSIKDYIGKLTDEPTAAEFYLDHVKLPVNPSLNESRWAITQAYGDFLMICPVVLFGEQFSKFSRPERRFYSWMLTQPAKFHAMELCSLGNWLGACHADELFFLFQIPKQTLKEDIQLSRDMISAWVNFAKNGNPGLVGQTQWELALNSSSSSSFMALDYNSTMVNGFYKETCQDFWKEKIFV